ncbi:selection and upkeep of intraepithelial T-cells protein 3-like [Colossoma macropomum]|uniref:selection and upkeep of intraepithelial T-cells protein 3-like n=1 Tax=Colossoma macropomum TaxID=42526 RepID=UPI00186401C2|nr:selection and upkeep of intraepithelial T-cells protein 3-like [Colossoma macropomum]
MKCVWVMMLFLHCALSEKFKVVSPGSPVSIPLGYNVILPCFVQRESDKASMNAEDLNVTWTKSNTKVHLYENKKDDVTQQSGSYKNRTALHKAALRKGDASLSLAQVKGADNGKFKCTVKSGSQEGAVEVDLQVKAIGTHPEITVATLQCKSKGWLPAPELEWLDSNGTVLTAKVTKTERDDKLFDVESSADVKSGDVFYCRVKQKEIVKEEKIKPYETCVSWIAVVGVLSAVLLVAVIVCVIKAKAR